MTNFSAKKKAGGFLATRLFLLINPYGHDLDLSRDQLQEGVLYFQQ